MTQMAVASTPFINLFTPSMHTKDFEIAVLRPWGSEPVISVPKEDPFTAEDLTLLMRSPFRGPCGSEETKSR